MMLKLSLSFTRNLKSPEASVFGALRVRELYSILMAILRSGFPPFAFLFLLPPNVV
jgi:hypothetical protein